MTQNLKHLSRQRKYRISRLNFSKTSLVKSQMMIKMETTDIILWCVKVFWYFLIIIGIGGNLALVKKYWTQKNQKLLFNFLILCLALFDLFYLIFLASNQGIWNLLYSLEKGHFDKATRNGLKRAYRALTYLEKICFSASVLTTIILAIERFLVCRKFNTNKCKFKWILVSIGNVQLWVTFVTFLSHNFC